VGVTLKNIVAMSIDDNYVWPLLSLSFSMWKNAEDDFEICIANVNGTLSANSQEIIGSVLGVMQIPNRIVDARIPSDVKTDSRISIAAYGRLWLADNLKEDFVYLDADSLAFNGWQEIFTEISELKDHPNYLLGALAAKTNRGLNWRSEQADTRQLCFHSTCLIISWDNWRTNTEKFGSESWYSISKRSNELNLLAHDQDILQFMAQGDFLHIREGLFELPIRPTRPAPIISSGSWIKPWSIREENLPVRIYEDIVNHRRAGGAFFLDEYSAFKSNEIELLNYLREVGLKNIANIENLREKLYTYKPPFLLILKFSLIIKLEKFLSAFHKRKIA
jgi:hypothetical protein